MGYGKWLQGLESNQRSSGYEPDGIPLPHPAVSCRLLAASALTRPIDSTASAFTNTAGDCPCFDRHTSVQGEATQSPCVLAVGRCLGFRLTTQVPHMVVPCYIRWPYLYQQEYGLLRLRAVQSIGMNGLESAGLQDTFPQRPNDRLHTCQSTPLLVAGAGFEPATLRV